MTPSRKTTDLDVWIDVRVTRHRDELFRSDGRLLAYWDERAGGWRTGNTIPQIVGDYLAAQPREVDLQALVAWLDARWNGPR